MPQIAVLGLGYAGLPVALAFARAFPGTLGFDVDRERVRGLAEGRDESGEADPELLAALTASGAARWTDDPARLAQADFYVVCVPTPIDAARRPDLEALRAVSRTVGAVLSRGDVVVYQSTVYPGATEEVCGPLLAEVSGLELGVDFTLGYAPERINPGDPEHGFADVVKVISAQDEPTLRRLEETYGAVVHAGLHRAESIRVAEAAKLLENVQRDLNIALMNELAVICDALGIETSAVVDAAATKWNFHRYRPGLVGGHCVGVDPYYLTAKAEELGLAPEVVLAGRRTNDAVPGFVVRRTLALLDGAGVDLRGARVAVLGAAFKPNVGDPRNSRVPELVAGLRGAGCEVLLHDPRVRPAELRREAGLELEPAAALEGVQAVLLAVPHRGLDELALALVGGGARVLVDVLGGIDPSRLPAHVAYWRL
ncbi:MAG: nucleotide sugar dehydrogenase [Planctomycetota bacterium]